MSESAVERLTRLLAMVPWLLSHQGIALAVAADELGISQDQLVKDLELLFVCGLPGHLPDDLIEADWSDGQVYLGNAGAISRPLRLGVDEALALIVGLRTLAEIPGADDRDAVRRALVKLEDAAGTAGEPAHQVQVDLGITPSSDVLRACREALQHIRRLQLDYLIPHRDETTRRQVDPIKVHHTAGRWYLEGWCHRAESVRMFRLDRIIRIEVLATGGTPPSNIARRDVDAGLFAPGPDDHLVRLELQHEARWVIDYYQVEDVDERPANGYPLVVNIRTGDLAWLRSLVLRLGGTGRVLHPPELAQQVQVMAQAALAAYDVGAQNTT